MPSKSAKQARTMAAAAHNPDFAKKVGIPQGVAKEFNQEDTRTSPKDGAGNKPKDKKKKKKDPNKGLNLRRTMDV